jgi:hypothetical protein
MAVEAVACEVDLGGLDLAADRFCQRASGMKTAACWGPRRTWHITGKYNSLPTVLHFNAGNC